MVDPHPVRCCVVFDESRKSPNEKCSEEEAQDAKILYYHPANWPTRQKRNVASLLEGIIAFTRLFTSRTPDFFDDGDSKSPTAIEDTVQNSEAHAEHLGDDPEQRLQSARQRLFPLRSIHTDRHTFVIEEVEPCIWMALVVRRRPSFIPLRSGFRSIAAPPLRSATAASTLSSSQPPLAKRSLSVLSSNAPYPAVLSNQQQRPATGLLEDARSFRLADFGGAWRGTHGTPRPSGGERDGRKDAVAIDFENLPQEAADDTYGASSTWTAVLLNCYRTSRLLHGTFRSLLRGEAAAGDAIRTPPRGRGGEYSSCNDDVELLQHLLEDFVPAYIDTIPATRTQRLPVVSELEGFQYAPVRKNVFLEIQTLVHILQREFPGVLRHFGLLYRGHMVFHTMSSDDMQTLYNYLVVWNGSVSATKLTQPPFGRTPTAACQPGGGSSSFGRCNAVPVPSSVGASTIGAAGSLSSPTGGASAELLDWFLFGPSQTGAEYGSFLASSAASCETSVDGDSSSGGGEVDEEDEAGAVLRGESPVFVPTVYLKDGSPAKLSVLLYYGVMLIFLLDPNDYQSSASAHLYYALRRTALPIVQSLLNPLAALFDSVVRTEDVARFVYFNSANNALRISNRKVVCRNQHGELPAGVLLSGRETNFIDRILCLGHGVLDMCRFTICRTALRSTRLRAHISRGHRVASGAPPSAYALDSSLEESFVEVDVNNGDDSEDCAATEGDAISSDGISGGILGVSRVMVKAADSGWISASLTGSRGFFICLEERKMDFKEAKVTEEEFRLGHFFHILM